MLPLFKESKKQIVHGTEGHMAVNGPVRHQTDIIWTQWDMKLKDRA
jgi:hypothetical protein